MRLHDMFSGLLGRSVRKWGFHSSWARSFLRTQNTLGGRETQTHHTAAHGRLGQRSLLGLTRDNRKNSCASEERKQTGYQTFSFGVGFCRMHRSQRISYRIHSGYCSKRNVSRVARNEEEKKRMVTTLDRGRYWQAADIGRRNDMHLGC